MTDTAERPENVTADDPKREVSVGPGGPVGQIAGGSAYERGEMASVSDDPSGTRNAVTFSDLSSVWLVDRSRVQRGRTGCMRARYREYHSGPTGYGIRRRAQSLPLATGSRIHSILEQLLRRNNAGPDAEVRAIIRGAAARYRTLCEKRGFLEMPDAAPEVQADVLRIIDEQAALIEAFGWALHLALLPVLLETWEPVLIEEELLLPLDDETVLMSKPDAIMRRKVDGALAQIEAKTSAWMHMPSWRKQWEDSAQLMLTKLAAQARLKQPVSIAYIFGLNKGKREAEKASGLVKQWSPFLYVYHRPANPPMVEEDWKLTYNYIGEDGKPHTVGKQYQRVETWTYDFPGKPAEMSPIEFWIRMLKPEEIMSQHEMLGPFDFLDHSEESILRSLRADEKRWRKGLWRLHAVGESCGWNEADPRFVEALDENFPQSWNCHEFGKDCPFLPICKREPCWAAPHEDEKFELRRPHHQTEIDQMLAREIQPPEDEDEEDEEA